MLQRIHANSPSHTFQVLLNYIVINYGLRISTRGKSIQSQYYYKTKTKRDLFTSQYIESFDGILLFSTITGNTFILSNRRNDQINRS